MRVLFLLTTTGADCRYHHGIALLSAILKTEGHEVALAECKKADVSLIEQQQPWEPDVLAATAVSQEYNSVNAITGLYKQRHPRTTILGGGIHFILHRAADLGAGFTCHVEAEKVLPLLLKYGDWEETDEYISESDLATFPIPDRTIFRAYKSYYLNHRPRFWFSRGCPYSCHFCCVPTLRDRWPGPRKEWTRFPPVQKCFDEIQYVADRWRFDIYVIDDDCWGLRKSWAEEWFAKYPNRLRKLGYEVNLRCEYVTPDLLRGLKDTGCVLVKFGLESGDYRLRKEVLNRNIKDERILQVFEWCREVGLPAHTFNQVGFPDETHRQVWKTIRLNQRLRPERTQISIYYPYSHSVLGDKVRATMEVRDTGNYVDHTALVRPKIHPRVIDGYARIFRLVVYLWYSPRKAWGEVVTLLKKVRDKFR